jgi:flagellar hook-associated protein 2
VATSTSSVSGLASGLDTASIIQQLMSIEQQPQNALKAKKDSDSTTLAVYQQLNTLFANVSTAATGLTSVTDWKAMAATSSSANVTASATSAASAGALSFTVQQLARAGSVASTGTVASTAQIVASGPVLVSKGADVLGFSNLAAGPGLTLGTHTFEVTQATSGASQTATTALSGSTTFAAPATLDVTVNGTAKEYTIAAGTYTNAQLATAVQNASGGDLTAAVGGDGRLALTTTHEGSTASLAVTGGTAAAALGLDTTTAATTGTDGAVSVDGGPTVAVTSAGPGAAQSFAGPNGTLQATMSGGLRVGSSNLYNVDSGNGSLAALAGAISVAGAGSVSAAAVNVGNGAYRLQLSSTTTGAGSNISVDTTNLTGGMASYATVQSGRDAVIQIGEGAGAYQVSSSSDSVAGVLPGVTLQLNQADPGTVVTVSVAADGDTLATNVANLIDAANQAVTFINQESQYDPTTKQAGLLLSDGMARTLEDQVYSAVSDAVAGTKLGSPEAVGISVAKDGTIAFDKSAFLTAFAADPAGVASLFRAGGTATTSQVSFLSASDNTRPGTYAVNVTQAATQGEADGTALSGAGIAAAEQIDVRVGGPSGTTASYSAAAGASLDTIATGLNAAFAEKGLALAAQVQAGKLVIRTSGYGSGANFELRSSTVGAAGDQTGLATAAGDWELHAGLDVAGTINGVTANGNGQTLIAPPGDKTLAGLALTISGTTTGDLGTFTFNPGAAQRLATVASRATDFTDGSITSAINSTQDEMRDLDGQISDWDTRLADKQDLLQQQFSNLETALGQLKNQGNWLTGQLASLPTSSAG